MDILIDSEIRNWVFIPIIVGMLLFSLIRMNIQKIVKGSPSTDTSASTENAYNDKKENTKLAKAKVFNANCNLLPHSSFENRKYNFVKEETGLLVYNQVENNDPMDMMQNSPMSNPDMLSNMLKGNLFMAVMMPIQFQAITYFFSGMVVGKVAFPLTQKFREMLQRGIQIENLDVKYISSLSLYFLAFLGVDKFFKIFLKNQGKLIRRQHLQLSPNAADARHG